MRCPFCQKENLKVLDKRDSGENIRRRRECIDCSKRFTTYETIEITPLVVIKKDNTRRPFERNKIKSGIFKACEKRPVSADEIEEMTSKIETKLTNKHISEIPSKKIGEEIMKELKKHDKVAYIRFASVYREFADIDDFKETIKKL